MQSVNESKSATDDEHPVTTSFFQNDIRLNALAESIAHIVWSADSSGTFDFANARWTEYTHISIDEDATCMWHDVVHPDDLKSVVKVFRKGLAKIEPFEAKARLRRWDGEYRWHLIRGVPNHDQADGAIRWVGTATDIHDIKQAFEDLRLKDHLLESVRQAIVALDATGKVVTWNPFAEVVFGYQAEEAIGQNIEDLVGIEGSDEQHASAWQAVIRGGKTIDKERQVRRKDGSVTWISVRSAPIRNAHGRITHIVASSIDISERRRLEAQYRHAQKMEAVGRLAGGVAHDFNNMLTVIKGHTEFLSRSLPAEGEAREDIDQIANAAHRASKLTRQLLAFSRQQVMDKRTVDINALLDELEKMLGRVIGEDINLELSLEARKGFVVADPGQLEQAVMNLAVNARDAMPEGGTLRIFTHAAAIGDEEASRYAEARPGEYVVVGVRDTGLGIAPEILPRIFDPFFTTKESGRGTGLGLATVYGIAQQLGGFVSVESEVSKGSTFRLYVPIASARGHESEDNRASAPSKGEELILVVEDQDEVRTVARRILTSNGYKVIEAANGHDALRVLQDTNFNVDLVLTDAVMPKMGGGDLVRAVRMRQPDLPVVMVSGYTDLELVTHGARGLDVPFLAKPFRAVDLLKTVRAQLAAVR
ncbi:MAG TPA: PAS domain S-box protein [Gemmatimonadaceae bacterium]